METRLLPPSLLGAVRVPACRCAPLSSIHVVASVQSTIAVVSLYLSGPRPCTHPAAEALKPALARRNQASCGGCAGLGSQHGRARHPGRHLRNRVPPLVAQGIDCSWPLDLYDWMNFPAVNEYVHSSFHPVRILHGCFPACQLRSFKVYRRLAARPSLV